MLRIYFIIALLSSLVLSVYLIDPSIFKKRQAKEQYHQEPRRVYVSSIKAKPKAKSKNIRTQTRVTTTSSSIIKTGQIKKELGLPTRRVKASQEELTKLQRMHNEIDKLSCGVDTHNLSRDLSFVIEELNSKGSYQVTQHTHLGKIRGDDILRYLKSELKRQGVKTEINGRALKLL